MGEILYNFSVAVVDVVLFFSWGISVTLT
jgi:hypothetical protein